MKRFMALLLALASLSILTARANDLSAVPYDDSVFSSYSFVRNDSLAYASASLADAAYQPGQIEERLRVMGFEPPRLDNYQNLDQGLTDYVASAMSRKSFILNGKPYDLFVIVVRGTHDDIEWASDFNLGWGWDHAGFVQAESDLMKNFREYYTGLEKGGKIDRDRDNNVIWITGHSRGAAIANLLAVQLRDYSYCPNEKIYAYTFACPRVTLQSIDQSKYQYIYNYNILADIFPHLPSSGILNSGYRLYGNIIELESFTNMHTKVVDEYEKSSGSSYNVMNKLTNHQMALYLSWMKVLYVEAMQTQVVTDSEVIDEPPEGNFTTEPRGDQDITQGNTDIHTNLRTASKLKPGDTFLFGHYEQDNNLNNGKEPIQWRVLAIKDGKTLLVSERNLDKQPYHVEMTAVTWETCTLRAWLNNDFLMGAFTAEERKAILTTSVKNEDNPYYGIDGGRDTNDRVFLLSIGEAMEYFQSDADYVTKNTAYADKEGITAKHGAGMWWLRSIGAYPDYAAIVAFDGSMLRGGADVPSIWAVRPALYVDFDSEIVMANIQESQAQEELAVPDSGMLETQAQREPVIPDSSQIEVGRVVAFGRYEQDNYLANGKEEILWRVLDVEDGKALLVSEQILEHMPYHESFTSITWENCQLRKWLNEDFLNSAFTLEEEANVLSLTIANEDNPDAAYGSDTRVDTKDKVFTLSLSEAKNLFASDGARQARATEYALVQGSFHRDGFGFWWLRSPGSSNSRALEVSYDGSVDEDGLYVHSFVRTSATGIKNNMYGESGVRPAIYFSIP